MTITRTRSLVAAAAIATVFFLPICASVSAEDTNPAPVPAPTSALLKEEELASLLAPIALYPDQVVVQILMASTYPLEVVEAHRWIKKNSTLQGEALASEAKKQSWDQSVQALTAFPDILAKMDEKLDWTQKLGDAFLAQQKDVMAMVQTLRSKAKEAGNLKSDEHQTVKVEPAPAPTSTATTTVAAPSTTTIVIEPADPQVIYIPTYSPTVVYGSWWYPSYPPYYFPYPPAYPPGTGFWWGVSVGVGIGIWGGAWNNHADWHGGDININRGDINIDRGDINVGGGNKWQHKPEHRKGVSYRDNATAQKYDRGSSNRAATARPSTGDAFRGRPSTGASAGTRDFGGLGGASAGTRDLSRGTGSSRPSTGSLSSSTSSRNAASRNSYGSRGSNAFGGMSSGARAGSYGSRGGMSRGGGMGGGRRR